MSTRFNHHATEFANGVQGIIDRWLAAKGEFEAAQAAYDAIVRRNHPQSSNKPTYRELADADERTDAARKAFNELEPQLRAEFNALKKDAGKAFEADVRGFFAMDGERFDKAFADLSEHIDAIDLAEAWKGYRDDGNGCMCRWCAAEAEKMLGVASAVHGEGVPDPRGADPELWSLYADYRDESGMEAVRAKWGSLVGCADRFAFSDWAPYWEKQTGGAVAAF